MCVFQGNVIPLQQKSPAAALTRMQVTAERVEDEAMKANGAVSHRIPRENKPVN